MLLPYSLHSQALSGPGRLLCWQSCRRLAGKGVHGSGALSGWELSCPVSNAKVALDHDVISFNAAISACGRGGCFSKPPSRVCRMSVTLSILSGSQWAVAAALLRQLQALLRLCIFVTVLELLLHAA